MILPVSMDNNKYYKYTNLQRREWYFQRYFISKIIKLTKSNTNLKVWKKNLTFGYQTSFIPVCHLKNIL